MEFVIIGGTRREVPPDLREKGVDEETGIDAVQEWHDTEAEPFALEHASANGLKRSELTGTGVGGRLTMGDVDAAIAARLAPPNPDDSAGKDGEG